MPNHKNLTYADNHIIHSFVYANETARTSATGLVSTDIGKVAYQSDDKSFWVLQNYSPVTWVSITAGGSTGGGAEIIQIPLASGTSSTNLGTFTRLGGCIFDIDDYTGSEVTLYVACQADGYQSYEVKLYDVTDGYYVDGYIYDDNAELEIKTLGPLTILSGAKIYELHAKLTTGEELDDYIRIPTAFLKVDLS